MDCPTCKREMSHGGLYVRGVAAALHWSQRQDVGLLSRRGLEQIDLEKASLTGTGGQAVLDGWRCEPCGIVAFQEEPRRGSLGDLN